MSGIPMIVLVGFGAIFALFFIGIVYSIVVGIKTWFWNNKQPVQTLPARVLAKSYENNVNSSMDNDTVSNGTPTCYVTFELDSGERKRFFVLSSEYDLLADGDTGTLKFQGTRYEGFTRSLKS